MSFDLQGFIEFCRGRHPDQRYDWSFASRCALGQFGFEVCTPEEAEKRGISRAVFRAAVLVSPQTFGALADRLEALR